MQSIAGQHIDWEGTGKRGWRLALLNFGYRARRLFGRRIRHLEKKRFSPPESAHTVFSFAVLGVALMFGMTAGGHTQSAADQFAAALGFSIEEVRISGMEETNQQEILLALDELGVGSLPLIDPQDARRSLSRLPWVESVSVAKLYPRTLTVSLTEKSPVARWQRGRNSPVAVIDQFGQVITRDVSPRLQSLPLVVGEGAEYQVAEIAGHMRKAAWLHARIYAAVLVSSRRWNLVTHAGVVIRLPEDEIASALARLEKQEIAHGVLDKDIRVVDLRFADRLILRLSPESAEQRRAEMKKNI